MNRFLSSPRTVLNGALASAVVLGLLTGTQAFAASRDEIVVTSTREAVSQFDLAESTGVITSAEIDSLHPTHPADLLERVPGVHLVWLGGDHHTTAIRQPINFNPVYLYLENGVPTRSTGFFETNALFDVNLPQARRIEITKGPGTALYGSDAIAGIINVLTPLPPEEDGVVTGNASFQASTREYYQGLVSLAGRTGKHGLRADVNAVYDDGWRDNTESDRQLGTFTWTIDATDNLSIQNVLMLANVDQDSSGSNLSRDDWRNNPKRNETPISFRLVDSARFHSIIEYRDGPQLFSITPFFRYNRVRLLPFFALGFDPHYEDIEATSLGAQAKYRRDFGEDFRLIAGFDVDYSWGDRLDIAIDPIFEDGIAVDFT
ncbi:MAG: TonB-dependent receptor plug domain-containing protein, partial [Alphaproteobacteria bacterium]|nr:TonB-dependent receptor plug domain-containing protein [Alphaproteobacteria bacterium]